MKFLTNALTHTHNFCTKLLATILLLQSFSPLQATTIGNYAEMSLALATIPLDIAANKHDLAKNTKKAALYGLAANSLSIVTKLLYLYNNIDAQTKIGGINVISRDLLANYTLTLWDLKNVFKNLKDLGFSHKKVKLPHAAPDELSNFNVNDEDSYSAVDHIGIDDDLLNFDFDQEELPSPTSDEISEEENEIEEEEDEELSQLVQKLRTTIFPSLKGITAFSLACAQDNATPYESISRKQARYLATSAHTLVRLLSEYSRLKSNSKYKKQLITALLALNTIWLAYEAKNYVVTMPESQEAENIVPQGRRDEQPLRRLPRENGMCNICYDNDNNPVIRLGCNHVCCMECLQGQINAHPLNNIPCIAYGCRRNISRDEFRDITNDNPQRLAAFDAAHVPVRAISPQAAARLGAKPCPGAGCGVPIYRNKGCQHMTCTQCRHQFCWVCLGDFGRGNGPCTSYQCGRQFYWAI